MNLVIDVGNNRVKAAIFQEKELLDTVTEAGHDFLFLSVVCEKYIVTQAIIATTVDLSEEAKGKLKTFLPFLLWLDADTALPVENLYETPRTLGYDRMAAVVGAQEICPGKDLLVIDAGTAITYEFLDAAGRYHGGNIAPGVQMRFHALHHYTGRLPLVEAGGRLLPLGKDTDTAIRAGVLKGIEYEIVGYITSLQAKYPELLVFLTGGDRFSFDTSVKNIIFADGFLVLKGLNRILNFNNGKL